MTQLRDARLHKALQAAPDAESRPSDAVRRAVRQAAASAVAPRKPWWHALWPEAGQRMPWNAAFATVLVGVLITLVWQDKEVPGARPDAGRMDPPVAASAPAASSPVAAAAAAPEVKIESNRAVAPDATLRQAKQSQTEQPAKLRAHSQAPAPAPAESMAVAAPRKEAEPARSMVAQAPAEQLAAPRDLRKSAEDSARRRDMGSQSSEAAGRAAAVQTEVAAGPGAAEAQSGPAGVAAPAPAAPAPAAAPPPVVAAARPSPPPAVARMAPAPPQRAEAERMHSSFSGNPNTVLRLQLGAQARVLQQSQAPRLAYLIDQALVSARAVDGTEWSAGQHLRIETEAGVLEVAGELARWTARGQAPRILRPDASQLSQLREEAQSLLR